jgi:O-antigen ligase
MVFFYSPYFALILAVGGLSGILLSFVLLVAWTANFTIFIKSPRIASLLALLALSAAVVFFYASDRTFGQTSVHRSLNFPLYFYFWAFGIGLIQLSKLLTLWSNQSLEPSPAIPVYPPSRLTPTARRGSLHGR